jgi:hypothetical protein
MRKEAGFIKQIIIIVILGLIVVFGYFAYQSFQKNKTGFDWGNIGGFFNKTVDDTKKGVEDAKNQAINDAKNQASDALKAKVDETLGTSK